MKASILFGVAVLGAAMPSCAFAQTTHYNVETLNFDLWCQQQANLPPDRCDKRLPDDETRFEAYRDTIEKYEIPYLQRKEKDKYLNDNILRRDPVDKPLDKSPTAQTGAQQPGPAETRPLP